MKLIDILILEDSFDLWMTSAVSVNFRLLLESFLSRGQTGIDDHTIEAVEVEKTSREKCVAFLKMIKKVEGEKYTYAALGLLYNWQIKIWKVSRK